MCVVVGKVRERDIAHTLIEELCFFITGANFQGYAEYPGHDSAFLEPRKQLASDASSSIGQSHSQKVQVCDVVAVAHDRKTDNFTVNACDQYVSIGVANASCYPHRCPSPAQTVFN